MKKILLTILVFIGLTSTCYASSEGAAGALCDIMIMSTGRAARGIGIVVIMGTAFLCFKGSISWEKAVTIAVGLALFFAPATFAIMLLPAKIKNVQGSIDGKQFYASTEYTPQEILQASCAEMF
jgi:type IV secretory pathway VirB2 component (pilin)